MNGNFPKFQNHLSSIIHPSVFSQRATDQLNDKPSCTTNSVVVGVVFDQPGVTIVHHILIQILDKSRSYRSQNMCVDLLKTLPLSQFQLGAARRGRAISSRNRFRFVMKTTARHNSNGICVQHHFSSQVRQQMLPRAAKSFSVLSPPTANLLT